MTIICWKNGVLAADSLVSTSAGVRVGRADKIARGKSGVLAGASGPSTVCERFLDWATSFEFDRFSVGGWAHFPDAPKEHNGFHGLVILPHGKVIEYDGFGRPETGCRADFIAIGSCYAMAIGAMAAGASAERAVEICIEHHADVGGPVKVLRLDDRGDASGIITIPHPSWASMRQNHRDAFAGLAGAA